MSRWFRHYAGMMRDEKLVSAAVKSKQPVERVVWVWGSLLESAAEINDGGRCDLDVDGAAYFLRCEAADLIAIVQALCDLGRIEDGRVTKWSDRQFESDGSKERQQRYRDKKRASRDGGVTSPDGGVTPQETEAETDTDTELETEITPPPVLVASGARDLFSELVEAFPANPSSSETKARNAFDRLTPMERAGAVVAAERYARWFGQDCEARGRTIDAGLSFVPHLSTWLAGGQWREASKLPIKGEVDPSLAVVKPGTPDFEALKRHRKVDEITVFGESLTVTLAELEQARAGSVH